MAFPGQIFNPIDLKILRQAVINALYITDEITIDIDEDEDGAVVQQLDRIAQILGRNATNEPTVYDNGLGRSSATGGANLLTQQVERALIQVLGRAPGREPSSFVNALNGAFPLMTNGKVMMTPSRSVVSLYSPVGNGDSPLVAGVNGTGLSGQLSVGQANLYRQASLNAADALRVLEGLKPFDPTADLDAVDALRSLVRTQINTLVEEFGRVDEPRKERVENYLNTLLVQDTKGNVTGGYLLQLGKKARLIQQNNQTIPVPVTIDDEALIAGYELLVNYISTVRNVWNSYNANTEVETNVTGRYSERLSRANIMLPVIADSNSSFMSAMDSIGFTAGERRSDSALFTTLGNPTFILNFVATDPADVDLDMNPPVVKILVSGLNTSSLGEKSVSLPDITVNDLNDWIDRFTTIEAPSILATSGQFGLDFVTDQSDTLFWVISIVLLYIENELNKNSTPLLEKVVLFERVKQTLSELVFQLDTLANLGVGSTSAS